MSTIYLYNFAKKNNSTAIPAALPVSVTGNFRQPLDVLNPVVVIESTATTSPFIGNGYNYVQIPELSRYYFIEDITALSDVLYELQLTVDVLASHKSAIGSSTQYVLRSASEWNASVQDSLYPIRGEQDCIVSSIATIPWYQAGGYNLANGWYIIGVTNKDANAVGSTSFYALNQTAFQSLRNVLFSSVSYTGMTFSELEEPLYKSLFNPMQYIVSCKWFPIQPDITGATSVTQIDLGFFQAPAWNKIGSLCYQLAALVKGGSISLNSVKHPLSTIRGTYLNTPPFLQRTLYVPPIGSIELDTVKMYGDNMSPTLYWYVDFCSGECRIRVQCTGNDNALVGEGTGMLGIDVSLAQQSQDILGAGTALATSSLRAAGGLIRGDVTGGIASAISGVASAASAFAPNVTSLAGNASLLAGEMIPYDQTCLAFPVNDDLADRGRPLCAARMISSLSGYILCAQSHFAGSGVYRKERDMIERFMDSGFFYE